MVSDSPLPASFKWKKRVPKEIQWGSPDPASLTESSLPLSALMAVWVI